MRRPCGLAAALRLARYPPVERKIAVPPARLYSTNSPHPAKPPRYGQPLPSTHPHLLSEPELTPGVTAAEYESRRRALMRSLPEGAVVLCMGGTVRLMSQSIFYKFRQSTDFFYLTGFDEPDAVAVLEARPSSSRGYRYTLFVPPRDAREAQWVGQCTGADGAVSIFGADEAFANTSFATHLPDFFQSSDIYISLPPSPSPSPASQPTAFPAGSSAKRKSSLLKLWSNNPASSLSSSSSTSGQDPPHLQLAAALASGLARPLARPLHKLRSIKSPAELAIMKRAADISAKAHRGVMRVAREGMPEARLQTEFEYLCGIEGSQRPAYVPVVASGANALVVHYTTNDCVVDNGDLVLIDAGCELNMYASDITRTFPASGHFTDPQRDLYTAVLNAQKELVRKCTALDGLSLNELHRQSSSLLFQELKQIGFKLSVGDVDRHLYLHFVSHHLGSDLHDCPTLERSTPLVEGNVITVEPGIYVPFDNAFPRAFHGQGVRIEDEVAVRKDTPWVLSEEAPKEVAAIEAVCQGS